MTETDMREGPTGKQCGEHSAVLVEGKPAFAIWYPQMGGYVGKAIVMRDGDCFNALVWHDGDFPFGDGEPREIHHCNAEQFIRFGEQVKRLLGA